MALPNWLTLLKSMFRFIDEFKVDSSINPTAPIFKIEKVSETRYKVINITVPLSPVDVYDVDGPAVSLYNNETNWESFMFTASTGAGLPKNNAPGFGIVSKLNGKYKILRYEKGEKEFQELIDVVDSFQTQLDDKQEDLGFTPEDSSKKENSVVSNDPSKYPTLALMKSYVESVVAGLFDYRGGYDASSNTYPTTGGSGVSGAIVAADTWVASVAGTLNGNSVFIGDLIIAKIDNPGQVNANWNVVAGSLQYTPENVANKVTSISGSSTHAQYASAKTVYDAIAALNIGGGDGVSINENQTGYQIPNGGNKYQHVGMSQVGYIMNTPAINAVGDSYEITNIGAFLFPVKAGDVVLCYLKPRQTVEVHCYNITNPIGLWRASNKNVDGSRFDDPLVGNDEFIVDAATNGNYMGSDFLTTNKVAIIYQAVSGSHIKTRVLTITGDVITAGPVSDITPTYPGTWASITALSATQYVCLNAYAGNFDCRAVVADVGVGDALTISSIYQFGAGGTANYHSTVKLASDKVLLTYNQGALKSVVLTITASVISFGVVNTLVGTTVNHISTSSMLTGTEVLVSYGQTNTMYMAMLSISGDVVTIGAINAITGIVVSNTTNYGTIKRITATTALFVFSDNANLFRIIRVNISGTVLSYISVNTFRDFETNMPQQINTVVLENNKVSLLVQTNDVHIYSMVIFLHGTDYLNMSTPVRVTPKPCSTLWITSVRVNSGRVITLYNMNSNVKAAPMDFLGNNNATIL